MSACKNYFTLCYQCNWPQFIHSFLLPFQLRIVGQLELGETGLVASLWQD